MTGNHLSSFILYIRYHLHYSLWSDFTNWQCSWVAEILSLTSCTSIMKNSSLKHFQSIYVTNQLTFRRDKSVKQPLPLKFTEDEEKISNCEPGCCWRLAWMLQKQQFYQERRLFLLEEMFSLPPQLFLARVNTKAHWGLSRGSDAKKGSFKLLVTSSTGRKKCHLSTLNVVEHLLSF